MKCDLCGSDRVIKFEAKCSDQCSTVYKDVERNGYVPRIDDDIDLYGGDYLCPAICLQCGKVQGEFPKPEPDFTGSEIMWDEKTLESLDALLDHDKIPDFTGSEIGSDSAIEQPTRITEDGNLFFLGGYSGGFGAEYGVRLTRDEYEAQLVEQVGPGRLVETDGVFTFEQNAENQACDKNPPMAVEHDWPNAGGQHER